uniref:Uncharacterized protein n=1 Tax=Davidia involucrata TaxID=16924 RepID=A0A5B7BHV6_DAVIN
MESSDNKFPGFQTPVPKDEFVLIRPMTRLQRRAPHPLQLKPTGSLECKSAQKTMACNLDLSSSSASSSSSSCSSFASYYHSKDPIPLLSPLVLPSLLESAYMKD